MCDNQGMKNTNIYVGYCYPSQISSHNLRLYHRFKPDFRDIEEALSLSYRYFLIVTFAGSIGHFELNTFILIMFFKLKVNRRLRYNLTMCTFL